MKIKQRLIFLLAVTITSFSMNIVASSKEHYGEGADMEKFIELSKVMSQPKAFLGKVTTIKGKVTKVCKKRGCWLELAAGKDISNLIVKVKDGDIVFPMSSIGRTAYATGLLSERKLSIDQTKAFLSHRAEEQNQQFNPASVKKGMMLYRFHPTGVTLM
ncbi:MAG: DUF4920 domain-containing protein [Parashewanella sp.]